MNRAPYTANEDTQIMTFRECGMSYLKIGRELGRSEDAVKSRYRLLTGYHYNEPKYPGCAGLVARQITTGQYNPVAREAWLQRNARA